MAYRYVQQLCVYHLYLVESNHIRGGGLRVGVFADIQFCTWDS